jgi:hypothetical protein
MSGRWSPINSPARPKKMNADHSSSPRGGSKSVLSDGDGDESGLPPSYGQDDKFTPSKFSHSSDAYSNLLNFLDNAAVSDHRDDISTISNSMASPQRLGGQRAFGTKKYVWDELPKDSASAAASAHESENLTYFKVPSYSNGGDGQSVGSASTLQSNIEEVRAKVEAMKSELRSRQQVVKELQSEHTRLKAAASKCCLCYVASLFYHLSITYPSLIYLSSLIDPSLIYHLSIYHRHCYHRHCYHRHRHQRSLINVSCHRAQTGEGGGCVGEAAADFAGGERGCLQATERLLHQGRFPPHHKRAKT